ncbi:MAG: hypothetical protein Q7R22_016680 [Verrucomicrobiota bacterium JB025]|nr:hypothetical protein [Verrucomicrobiota bacterium JB025]
MKTLLLLTLGLLTAGAASAATLSYTFENSANISGTGTEEVYTAPDTNDFGSGVTVSDFTLTDRDSTEYSRFVNIGGGSVEAALGDGGEPLIASFTITIDSSVSVDFTSISWDESFWINVDNKSSTVESVFSTTDGSGTKNIWTQTDWTHDGVPNYQSNDGLSATFSGLTGLTDTTVTFSWAVDSSRSNEFSDVAHGIDDIVLTGTISAVPEPGNFVFGGLLVLIPVMARRRSRR